MLLKQLVRDALRRRIAPLPDDGDPRPEAAPARTINPLFDADYYRERYALPTLAAGELYDHYRTRGIALNHDPNALFSTRWYVERNADVRRHRLDPLDHYLRCGAAEGRDPGPDFSTYGYHLLHADVRGEGMNPLLHYLRHGRAEGRLVPSNAFLAQSLREPFAAIFADRAARDRMAAAARRGQAGTGEPAPPPPRDAAGPADIPLVEDAAADRIVARRSRWLCRWAATLFSIDLAASFDAVRLLGPLPAPVAGPLVLFTNHPSRWDAELFHWLSREVFPDRRGFAPMALRHLRRHPIFARLGAYPIRAGRLGGAAAFLKTTKRLLRERDAVVFIAAEGKFSDVRARPVRVLPGVAHLARHAPHATFVPLAIDYVFWNARRPTLLLHFGLPVPPDARHSSRSAEVAGTLSGRLTAAMSALAEAAQTREPTCFTVLLRGGGLLAALRAPFRRAGRAPEPAAQDAACPAEGIAAAARRGRAAAAGA